MLQERNLSLVPQKSRFYNQVPVPGGDKFEGGVVHPLADADDVVWIGRWRVSRLLQSVVLAVAERRRQMDESLLGERKHVSE